MPCPLCLAGLKEPHTKSDWDRIRPGGDLREHLDAVLEERRAAHAKWRKENNVPDSAIICG